MVLDGTPWAYHLPVSKKIIIYIINKHSIKDFDANNENKWY
jgi:hypothetical protein